MASIYFSSLYPLLNPIGQGLYVGYQVQQNYEDDKTYRQGRNFYYSGLAQSILTAVTWEQLDTCLRAVKGIALPQKTYMMAWILPGAIAWAANHSSHPLLKRATLWIHDHLSVINTTINVISLLALGILQGQTILMCTSLTYMGLKLLSRENYFPLYCREILSTVGILIGNLSGIYCKNFLIKLVCITDLAGYVLGKTSSLGDHTANVQAQSFKKLSSTELLSFITEIEAQQDIELALNREHLQIPICPELKNEMGNEEIKGQWEQFISSKNDWTSYPHLFDLYLKDDDRWKVDQSKSSSHSLDVKIAYIQNGLHQLIQDTVSFKIFSTSNRDPEEICFALKFILQECQDSDLDASFVMHLLIQLGIQGNGYCDPRKIEVIEGIYFDLLMRRAGQHEVVAEVPKQENTYRISKRLETKILTCLLGERRGLLKNLYYNFWKSNPIMPVYSYLYDAENLHIYHLFLHLFEANSKYGIHSIAAAHDKQSTPSSIMILGARATVQDYIDKCFWKDDFEVRLNYLHNPTPADQELGNDLSLTTYTRNPITNSKEYTTTTQVEGRLFGQLHLIQKSFWLQGYGPNRIVDFVTDYVHQKNLQNECLSWWRNWIQTTPSLTQEGREILESELDESSSIDGHLVYDAQTKRIQPAFIEAMLIEMQVIGILNTNH